MKLKCETILSIYTYRNTKVLCQIKVQSSNDNKQKNREWKNTCRRLTPEQWKSFDKELKNILEILRDNRDEVISTFGIKPNIEVKVQKSKLPPTNFYNFMDDDDDGVDDSGGAEGSIDNIKKFTQNSYVLEFILILKQQPPSISSVEETQDYEPNPKTSPDNIFRRSLSYEPYTPSKKKYRANSFEGIKTPGADFLHESFEDVYLPRSPKKTTRTELPIPVYKPAPIKEKRFSQDSQTSNPSYNDNEVIAETDEELLSPAKLRSKVFTKKTKREIKCISKSQEKIKSPVYFPNPIEEKNPIKNDSQEDNKSRKHNNKDVRELIETLKDVSTLLPKRSNSQNDVKERISNKLEYREKLSSTESNQDKVKKILERKATTSSSEDDIDKFGGNMGIKNYHKSSPENKSATTDVSPPINNTTEKQKFTTHHEAAQLRRSRRSPVKPKRLIEEQPTKDTNRKKINIKKCSPSNKELFGTDYDDDDEDDKGDDNNNDATNEKSSILQTPKCQNPKKSSSSSASSSTKKKRKRDKSNKCEQEKRDIITWLGKKKSDSEQKATTTSKENWNSTKDHKRSRSKSVSPLPDEFVMPSKEELEKIRVKTKLQQEQNEKMKAELEKISAPPPKQVQTLSLKDMSVNDLLDTFSDYKLILDEIYKKNCKKDHIKSHEGLNHCFVIRLMEQQTQYKMLQKLTDVYRNSKSSTQATLYANAMLPEWIIRIYMEKYKFTRAEAMQQIKAQDDYQMHIDEQSDNSFLFD